MAKGPTIILHGDSQRAYARRLLDTAEPRSVVEFRPPARTNDQNAKFHAMLTDIARAKPQGRVLSVDVWKALMMHEAGFKCTFEPSLDGQGVVPLGFKSSRLSKAEFGDLITAASAYGDTHGVVWSEPRDRDGAEGGDAKAAPVPQDRQARAARHRPSPTTPEDHHDQG